MGSLILTFTSITSVMQFERNLIPVMSQGESPPVCLQPIQTPPQHQTRKQPSPAGFRALPPSPIMLTPAPQHRLQHHLPTHSFRPLPRITTAARVWGETPMCGCHRACNIKHSFFLFIYVKYLCIVSYIKSLPR